MTGQNGSTTRVPFSPLRPSTLSSLAILILAQIKYLITPGEEHKLGISIYFVSDNYISDSSNLL